MSALLRRSRAGARARLAVIGEEREAGAALLTVLLFILVLSALSIIVLGSLINQVRPTAFTQDSSRSLFAAEAGVQATLGQVRTAVTTLGSDTYGDRSKLPCAVNGAVGEGSTALVYDVGIAYFTDDPAGHDAKWRKDNAKACTPGSGTALTPAYAIITSTGRAHADATGKAFAGAGPRTLESKYTFKVTNQNIAGGLMYTVTQKACLQAASVAVGSSVSYAGSASCVSGTSTQMWVYDTDYAIKLAVTTGTTTGSGSSGTSSALCLTGPGLGDAVTLQPCVRGQVDQLWSYEGGAHFRGQNSGNTGYGSNCLWAGAAVSDPSVGNLTLKASDRCASNEDWGSFLPEPRVGAGAASKKTEQIVNYLQFGRCFDVTNEDVNKTYMIVYPCKQDPSSSGGNLKWNHKWSYDEPQAPAASGTTTLVVHDTERTRTTVCLNTPLSGTNPAYVTLMACNGSDSQEYTRNYDTGSYATSYTFTTTEAVPRCLSLGPQFDVGGITVSTIVAAACTGGAEQKWNAPPNALSASLSDTRELLPTGTGG